MSAHPEAAGAVAASFLFADLTDSERAEIAALLRPFELEARDVLFKQGGPADGRYQFGATVLTACATEWNFAFTFLAEMAA